MNRPMISIVGNSRQAHPAAMLFPLMAEDAVTVLAEDIRANGLIHPIVLHPDGSILDGRSRSEACRRIAIEPSYETWTGKAGEEVAYVVSANLHRRHLNESQRGMIAASIANMKVGNPQLPHLRQLAQAVSQSEAAALLNVSRGTLQRAHRVRVDGTPELVQAVVEGRVSVTTAVRQLPLRPPKAEQEIAVPIVRKGAIRPIGQRSHGRPVDEIAREVSARRESGESIRSISQTMHLSVSWLALIGDIAFLADRHDLPPRVAIVARQAWDQMITGACEDELHALIDPVTQRLWGQQKRFSGRGAREKHLREKFEDSMAILSTTCECAADLPIPLMPVNYADDAISRLGAAIRHLQAMRRTLVESKQ